MTCAGRSQGGRRWLDVPGAQERVHGTQPDARDIKAGPVERPAPIDRDAAVEPQLGLLERHNAVERGISAGTLDLDQYKQTFAALVQDEAATKAEISKLSKDDLLRSGGASFAYRYKGEKKDVIVNAGFNAMLETYALGRKYGSSSFIMSPVGFVPTSRPRKRLCASWWQTRPRRTGGTGRRDKSRPRRGQGPSRGCGQRAGEPSDPAGLPGLHASLDGEG